MKEHPDERASPSGGGRAEGGCGLSELLLRDASFSGPPARGRAALAACAALAAASCVPLAGRGSGRGPVHLEARPVAALAGAVGDEPDDGDESLSPDALITPLLPAGIGVRGGITAYPVTSHRDVEARFAWGGYFHFAEKETRRFEGSLSYCWDTTDGSVAPSESENHAYMAGLNYVSYLGTSGFLYWSVGGGVIAESLYVDDYFFGYLEAAAGYWMGSGQKGIDIRAGLQTPFGSDVNVNVVVFVAIGYDI